MLCWVVWKLLYATFHIRPFWSLIIQEKSDIFTVDNYEGVKTNRIYQVIQWGLSLIVNLNFLSFVWFILSSQLSQTHDLKLKTKSELYSTCLQSEIYIALEAICNL